MDHLVVPVALFALALAVVRMVAWGVAGAWDALLRRGDPSLSRWTPMVLGLPLAFGVATAVGVLVPANPFLWVTGACHCSSSDLIHICPFHPPDPWPLLPISLAVLAAVGVRPLVRLGHLLRDVRRANDLAGLVSGNSLLVMADLSAPNAITVGWFRPRIIVDRSWWRGLGSFERQVVLAHEQAHLRRRDPLTLMVLRVLLAFAPAETGRALLSRWEDLSETLADRHAGHAVGDPLAVAEILVRQYRSRHSLPAFVAPFGGGRLECRVRALLAEPSGAIPLDPDLDGAALVGVSAVLVLVLAGAPYVHAAVEAVLNHLL